jgi:probable F420-dependent oxidoreductase
MGVAIGLGLSECPFKDPGDYWRWIDLCEAGGIDSMWQTDRLVGPHPMLETLTVMAALAGRTKKMKFGMNVLSAAFRDPVLVAKQCATIDFLSGGRLLPAFGIGSPKAPEWNALAIDTRGRGKRTDEALEIIQRLWKGEAVDYDSVYFNLRGARIDPLPIQAELPLWIGGGSNAAIRRTARIGTGWMGGSETAPEAARIVAGIKAELGLTGRAIDDDHYGTSFPVYIGTPDAPIVARAMQAYTERTGRDANAVFAVGEPASIVERIAGFVDGGVYKFVLRPVGADADETLAQTRRIIEDVIPAVASRFA